MTIISIHMVILWPTRDARPNAWSTTPCTTSALVTRSRPGRFFYFMLVDVTFCPNRSLGSGSGGGRLWRWLTPTSSCRTPFCLRFILKQPRHAYSFQDDSISSQNYGNQNLLSPTMTSTKELVLTNCKLTSVFFLSPFFGWLGDKPRSAILYSLDKPTHHKTRDKVQGNQNWELVGNKKCVLREVTNTQSQEHKRCTEADSCA